MPYQMKHLHKQNHLEEPSLTTDGCCVRVGRSGIMEAASIGAKKSDSWTGHQIIGILPNENHGGGKSISRYRTSIGSWIGLETHSFVRFCDVCVALSGGAGTLSEIALAWQFERPVAVMSNSGGWSERLSGMALDHRQPPINGFEEVSQVIDWIKHQLDK